MTTSAISATPSAVLAVLDIPAGPYTPDKLMIVAAKCLTGIRSAFPDLGPAEEQRRQVFAQCEEIGEVLAAYRRWSGMARRSGPIEDVAEELADVRLTAYVAADVFQVPLSTVLESQRQYTGGGNPGFWGSPQLRRADAAAQIAQMQVVAGLLAIQYVDPARPANQRDIAFGLACAVQDAVYTAAHLGIDLDAATDAKLPKIFGRGFRDDR